MNQFKFLKDRNNFLGIKNSRTASSKVYIVPYGLEKTVSYGKGTSLGPKKILNASQQLELYDIELGIEPSAILSPKTLDINKKVAFFFANNILINTLQHIMTFFAYANV